mgnify:CR=1 FL=1
MACFIHQAALPNGDPGIVCGIEPVDFDCITPSACNDNFPPACVITVIQDQAVLEPPQSVFSPEDLKVCGISCHDILLRDVKLLSQSVHPITSPMLGEVLQISVIQWHGFLERYRRAPGEHDEKNRQ